MAYQHQNLPPHLRQHFQSFDVSLMFALYNNYMDFKKGKGEWHSAWGSAVQHRRCKRGHKQASKSLQGARLIFSVLIC